MLLNISSLAHVETTDLNVGTGVKYNTWYFTITVSYRVYIQAICLALYL